MDTISINVKFNREEEKCTFPVDMTIKEVLETLCQKHGLKRSQYVLSYKNYFLSENLPLKTIDLVDEETLEIVKDFRPTINDSVKIVLQIKDTKMTGYFHPDVTLWTAVNNLVASITLQIPYATPVLTRKGQEYIGYDVLNGITPRLLGVANGSLLFRFFLVEDDVLSRRTAGLLGSAESMQFELSKVYELSNIYSHKVMSTESLYDIPGMDDELTFAPGLERRGSSVFEEISYLGDRNALAFRLPKNYPHQEQPDNFYDLHPDDVQVIYKNISKKRKLLKEKLLRPDGRSNSNVQDDTDETRTVIRVQFPDRTVLQGVFNPSETIKDVEEFVKEYRRIPKEFNLIVAPPKVVLDSNKTLAWYNLVPNGKIYYKPSQHPERTAYLKETVLRRLSTHEGACYAAAICRPKQQPIAE